MGTGSGVHLIADLIAADIFALGHHVQVMLKENDQMKAEMDRYENMICASQATHSLTASTVGA